MSEPQCEKEEKETRVLRVNNQLDALNSELIDLNSQLTTSLDSLVGCVPENVGKEPSVGVGSTGLIGRLESVTEELKDTGKRLEKTIERINISGLA